MFAFKVKTEGDFDEAAVKLLSVFPKRKIFAFYGQMGAGKTTFIRAICRQLGVADKTSSPSFSIVNEYALSPESRIFHFDFYRMKSLEEAYDIGYEEYFYSGHYCFIEWAEKAEMLLPEDTVRVKIEIIGNDRLLST